MARGCDSNYSYWTSNTNNKQIALVLVPLCFVTQHTATDILKSSIDSYLKEHFCMIHMPNSAGGYDPADIFPMIYSCGPQRFSVERTA